MTLEFFVLFKSIKLGNWLSLFKKNHCSFIQIYQEILVRCLWYVSIRCSEVICKDVFQIVEKKKTKTIKLDVMLTNVLGNNISGNVQLIVLSLIFLKNQNILFYILIYINLDISCKLNWNIIESCKENVELENTIKSELDHSVISETGDFRHWHLVSAIQFLMVTANMSYRHTVKMLVFTSVVDPHTSAEVVFCKEHITVN